MKTRITHSSYVLNFLNVNFATEDISTVLEAKVDGLLEKGPSDESLEDWEVVFNALYTAGEKIWIYRKTRSYPSEKYKEIVIHIPIPTKSIVSWGVDEDQLLSINTVHAEKYAESLETNFTDFDNRNDYIMSAMLKSISFCFRSGFKVNKKLIKLGITW